MARHTITTAKNIDELTKLGSVASLAWSSSGTTVSITQANHGYQVGDPFYVSAVTGTAGLTTGAKTVLGITSSSVFTVTGTSGTQSGTCTVIPHETFNVDGGTLTIDQDTRVGLNANVNAGMGNITLSATLGGTCNIDGSTVWMIPYTGGSGNVPAWNTAITRNGATGKLIGVHSALTAASTATGAAMPASGFIRVKQKTGDYTAGALTGITATASDAGRIGWIEVVGVESFTVNANRLGTFNVTGAWYEVGTTNGSSNQTMQIPNNGLLRHIAGVFIEKTAGQADYEFYPNAGTTTTTGTEATRGKVVWIDNTGLVRIGNSGAATNGFTPATGLKVVVGNVFLTNCTAAAPTANVIPNATIATRYDFTTTGGGVINIDKCDMQWYLSCTQAYSVTLSNSGFCDAINMQEIASPMTWSKVGVGNKSTTALLVSPLTMLYCFAGGTFTDCVFARVSLAASGAYISTLTDCAGFSFTRCTFRSNTIRGNATTYSLYGTRLKNFTFTDTTIIGSQDTLITCDGITYTNIIYVEGVSGTTPTTYAGYVWALSSNTINCTFSGLTLPVTNNHPYTAILTMTTGCANIKLRSIGTRAAPVTLGSANACGAILMIPASAACSDIKVQRVYMNNTRLNGIYYASATSPDNSTTRVTLENVHTDYGDNADLNNILNLTRKGIGGIPVLTAATGIYGTHFIDNFSSTTAGRLAIVMNEPSSLTASQVTLTGGAAFTATGGLYMPTIGMTATFETPYYVIGHTQFANSALVMAGGTATNYTYEFAIDLNDGNGYSAMTTASYTATQLGTALNAKTLDAAKGFKLKLKITTGTGNATAITSVYMTTVSSTTAQDYQYPLDVNTVTFTGLVSGSDVTVTTSDTNTVVGSIDQTTPTSWGYTYSGAQTVDVKIIKAGYVPYVLYDLALGTTDSTLPIAQTVDRNYQ